MPPTFFVISWTSELELAFIPSQTGLNLSIAEIFSKKQLLWQSKRLNKSTQMGFLLECTTGVSSLIFSSHKSAFLFIANLALADALLVVAEFVIVWMENSAPINSHPIPEIMKYISKLFFQLWHLKWRPELLFD